MPVDLEDELDRLYGEELAGFVRERTRLASALRKEGRRAEAEHVQQLRKPSVSVWAVNQLARGHRKEIELLLDAGDRLAAAQRALLAGGDRQAFDRASKAERDALNRLSTEARSILAERGSTATLERVISTLRAAALSEAARPDLARGRLTDDVDPAGFDAFTDSPTTAAAPPKPKPPLKRADEDRAKREQARRQETKRAAINRARAELTSASDHQMRIAKHLRDLERAERAARAEFEQAERAATRARADQQAAATAVEAARAKLEEAER